MNKLSAWFVIVILAITPVTVSAQAKHESTSAGQNITIRFKASVGDQPFNCASTYEGIGSSGAEIRVTDFRFFVSDVHLIDAKGRESRLSLSNDGKWQNETVALIAFESGAGRCNPDQVNMEIRGTVNTGSYTGLRFTVGVPRIENHADPATAPSPLNLSRMFWSWNDGYKFMRLEMSTVGRANGYLLHLGSTGCRTEIPGDSASTQCRSENRPEIYLPQFNSASDFVKVDLKALLNGVNVGDRSGGGCMSSPGDTACAGAFKNLGLSSGGAATQTFMRAERLTKNDSGLF
jgi:uncharacterized repeat protein (TIGR04052 family)